MVNKEGKVLAAEPGSPSGTVDVVKKLVESGPATNGVNGAAKDDIAKAEVAVQVADTAEKLDSKEEKVAA